MNKKISISRVLAIIGTVLVWLPILATLVTGMIGSISMNRLIMDYLMPAELFPLAGIGGLLLIVAAILARSQRKWIIWSFVIMIAALVISQGTAVVSGLASGRIEATGFWWILVLGLIILYALVMIILGIGGIKLIKCVFKKIQEPPVA